uniref:Uncharacterized protein n=1 Tax=Magnetococcus massalia (strain MO-1) TaxID=451514 RepID=A0A1S7LLC8_MAGMO|nr:Protein of unknown function [Candidatus Magnetococcus massalia]
MLETVNIPWGMQLHVASRHDERLVGLVGLCSMLVVRQQGLTQALDDLQQALPAKPSHGGQPARAQTLCHPLEQQVLRTMLIQANVGAQVDHSMAG